MLKYHMFSGCDFPLASKYLGALAFLDVQYNAFKAVYRPVFCRSKACYGIIQHLYQFSHARYPLSVYDKYHHYLSRPESGLYDHMAHEALIPPFII